MTLCCRSQPIWQSFRGNFPTWPIHIKILNKFNHRICDTQKRKENKIHTGLGSLQSQVAFKVLLKPKAIKNVQLHTGVHDAGELFD